MSKFSYAILGAALFGGAAWFLFFNQSGDAQESGFTLETARVERGEVAQIVSASGAVRALITVEVGSQVSGKIIALNADYNSDVKEGEIIALIDPQTFETRVASAKADVQSAQAGVAVQQANIESAKATLAQAERDYARQQALYAADAVAQSTLEDNERALAVAKANLNVARAQLQTSQALISQRQASLRSAQVDMERTIIRSPIDGVVISRDVDVGQTVAASFSAPVLFTIAQNLEDIRIDAAVVEADIGGINAGDTAKFNVDAYPDESFEGKVEQVRLASETLQNVVTYTVVIESKNQRGRLLPGMTANVEITADKREDVLRVAETAIRFRPPTSGPEVVDSASNGTSGERSRGGQNGSARSSGGSLEALNDLGISAEIKETIEAELQKEIEAARSSLGGRAQLDRNALRQRMQAASDKVLLRNLTSEQYKQLQTQRNAQASVVSVEAYAPAADDQIEKKTLVLGLQDGAYAEILRGADVGDEFVTRVRVGTANE